MAVDVAAAGKFGISFLFDPYDTSLQTPVTELEGSTFPLPAIPVEVGATNISIKVEHQDEGEFELAGISLHYQVHGNYNT